MKKKFSIVGKPVIRQDGYEKVTGKAKFADDYRFHGQLYGVMVRLPVAHAKIKSIDYSSIKNNSAVAAICDHTDISGNKKVGPVRKDQPIFCYDKIVTPGDVVAMLVGESECLLRELVHKIKVEYEKLPVLTDPQKALKKNSPLIHPQYKNNLIVHYPLRKGDIKKGFDKSDHIIEQTYTTPRVEHAFIEPECVTALPLKGGTAIHIIGSIQNPF